MDHIPVSKHTGWCGDAFISKLPLPENDENGGGALKLPPWKVDENGAVYEDIPHAFVESALYAEMLEVLHLDDKEVFKSMWPAFRRWPSYWPKPETSSRGFLQ